jgi:hypothetical protein
MSTIGGSAIISMLEGQWSEGLHMVVAFRWPCKFAVERRSNFKDVNM